MTNNSDEGLTRIEQIQESNARAIAALAQMVTANSKAIARNTKTIANLTRNVEVILRTLEVKGFVLLPKRWVVERTFG